MRKPNCVFPGCAEIGWERHHIVYGSGEKGERHYQIHYYCRKSKKGNTSEIHPGETVPLCHEHHLSITKYNHRMWVVNRYTALSCHQRRKFWKLWLKGEYPPGVSP